MPRTRLTERHLQGFLAANKSTVVGDEGSKLECRVRPRQGRAARIEFIIRYRSADGKQKTHTLGVYRDELTLAQARELADAAAPKLRARVDLNFERNLAARQAATTARLDAENTFDAAAQKFFERCRAQRRRKRTLEEYEGLYRRYIADALASRSLTELKRAHFGALADALMAAGKGPATIAGVLRLARAIMRSAEQAELIENAPSFAGLIVDAEKRSRRWRDGEVAVIWRAAEALDPPRSQFLRAAILLVARRTELSRLKWEHVLPDRVVFPAEDTKRGREHVLPLTPLARDTIEELRHLSGQGSYVFSFSGGKTPLHSFGQTMTLLRERFERPLPSVMLHDTRRTFAGWAIDAGFSEPEVAAILSHRGSGSVTAGYIGAALGGKRRILAAWHAHIAQSLGRTNAPNVIALPATGA